jgi:predicted hydrolase (HD superfamily)
MSLLDNQDLMEIKLYYKYAKVGNGKKLVILEDNKAEEMLKDEEKSKEVEVLETHWAMLNWKEQNEVMNASSQAVDPMTGEKQFNFLVYRDAIIKRCLKQWNLTMNEKPVPVSAQAIDKLPGPVVVEIYQKFEKYIEFTEEELGN